MFKFKVLIIFLLSLPVLAVEVTLENGLIIDGKFKKAKRTKVYIEKGDTLFIISPEVIVQISESGNHQSIEELKSFDQQRINFNSYKQFVTIDERSVSTDKIKRAIILACPASNPGIELPEIVIPSKISVDKKWYIGIRPIKTLGLFFNAELGVRNIPRSVEKRMGLTFVPLIPVSALFKFKISVYEFNAGIRKYFKPNCRDFYYGYGLGTIGLQIVPPKTFLGLELPDAYTEKFQLAGMYGELGYTGHPTENTITHLNMQLLPGVTLVSGRETEGKTEYGVAVFPWISFTIGYFIR